MVGTDPEGAPAERRFDGGDRAGLLVFLTSSCEACQGFWAGFAGGRPAGLPADSGTTIITPGAALESRRTVAELAPPGTPVVMSGQAWTDYEVSGSPFAVVVRHGMVVAEGPVLAWDDLEHLIAAVPG